ncbi:hypothetical protein G7Y89_g290 [Cudoniella acicularis]|uniref:Uncharacterized protein n=1 Tax=Cudoniella acicularis TaxID=354080 RepID=A0A8H4RYF2_9HELO|nr:hypothetical protein G7Y89_g290 [Cudoniella acicularis]
MPNSTAAAAAATKDPSHYPYSPSLDVAIVVSALWSLAFILTAIQWFRYKSWVWLVMVLASAMEPAGYISRCLSIKSPTNKSLYIVQFALVVLAPVLMAGACYVVFLTPLFVTADIIALFLQLIGTVIVTSVTTGTSDAVSKANKGKRIAQIGVAVQLAFFGLFSIIAVRFNFTSKRFSKAFEERLSLQAVGSGSAEGEEEGGEGSSKSVKYVRVDGRERLVKRNWQAILRVTNIASVLILIRSVYRMVDFSLGRTGYTSSHEWCIGQKESFERDDPHHPKLRGKKKIETPGQSPNTAPRLSSSRGSSPLNEANWTLVTQASPTQYVPNMGIQDEGLLFFFTHYMAVVKRNPLTGQVEPSPAPFWHQIQTSNTFCNAISSVGFAGLSNVTKNRDHKIIARNKYATAISDVKTALENMHRADLETTLKSVMLLAAFEVVNGNSSQLAGWGIHLEGAAVLLEMMGKQQKVAWMPGLRMRIQFAFSCFTKCLADNQPVSPSMLDFTQEALRHLPPRDSPAAELALTVASFVDLHAASYKTGFTNSQQIVQQTLALDAAMETWVKQLPEVWRFDVEVPEDHWQYVYNNQVHRHQDPWTARVWNNYRWARIYIHSFMLVHLGRLGSFSHENDQQRAQSLETILVLATDICSSVSTQFSQRSSRHASWNKAGPPVSGLFLLLFPLVVAGGAIGVPETLHNFAVQILEVIGNEMGVQQALVMVESVKRQRRRWLEKGVEGFDFFAGFQGLRTERMSANLGGVGVGVGVEGWSSGASSIASDLQQPEGQPPPQQGPGWLKRVPMLWRCRCCGEAEPKYPASQCQLRLMIPHQFCSVYHHITNSTPHSFSVFAARLWTAAFCPSRPALLDLIICSSTQAEAH